MAQTAAIHNPLAGIVLPGVLLVGLLGLIAAQTGLLTVPAATASMSGPETVTIAPRNYLQCIMIVPALLHVLQ